MKKLAFVIPWFSATISGGAEIAMRDLTDKIAQTGQPVEILTTCVEKFASDWSTNYFYRGVEKIGRVPVRRFKAEQRNTKAFDRINQKFMNSQDVSTTEEAVFLNEMVNSDEMYQYIREHHDEYSLFVFTPYMFGTTYFGAAAAKNKAVLIPCFHEEPYAHMKLFKKRWSSLAGMAFLAQPESDLAHELYDLARVKTKVLGLGVEEVRGNADRFLNLHQLDGIPFILYAGRKDAGKNVDVLIDYFVKYRAENPLDSLKLVLIGGGNISIPILAQKDILDLGFVSSQEKADAYAAATLLCQPSEHESFSIVIMESWLAGRPVLVSGHCAVTRNFVVASSGGLFFENYKDFAGSVRLLTENSTLADRMGRNGQEYVKTNFCWDSVAASYLQFFKEVADE